MFREHEQPLLLLLPLPPLPLRPQLPFLPILSIIVQCTTIQRLYGNVPSLEKKRRRCRFLSCPWSPSVQSTFLRKHFWKHIWSFIPLKKKKLLFVLQPSRSFNISEWMMVIGRHQDVRKIQIWKHSGSCRNHIKHELGKKWTVIKKSFLSTNKNQARMSQTFAKNILISKEMDWNLSRYGTMRKSHETVLQTELWGPPVCNLWSIRTQQ